MSFDLFSSLGPILAAPWRQRRNAGSLWGVAFVVFMVFLGPAVLFGLAAFGVIRNRGAAVMDAQIAAAQLLASALNATACAAAVLVLAWWAMVVSNLLDQNRPVLASLVPRHPARLRAAMVVAWAASTAVVTGLVGGRFGVLLVSAAVAGPVLALVAVSIRWPLVWIVGLVAPVVVDRLMRWPGLDPWLDAVRAQWAARPGAITATLAAVSVVALAALIQSGGRRHIASDQVRRQRVQRFQARARGMQPVAVGKRGLLEAVLSRPYYAWWQHAVARPGTSAFERLMLGLGPGVHWTSCIATVAGTAAAISAGFAVCDATGQFVPWLREFTGAMFAGAAVGIVPGMLAPALQVQARLYQSRREQALLVLLPGMARGAALSRRLAWQLSGQFLATWAGACLVLLMCQEMSRALHVNPGMHGLQLLSRWSVIGMLPVVVFQWRAWARVGAPTSLNGLLPLMVAALVMALVATVTRLDLLSETSAAIIVAIVTLAWGALRWHRMAGEPAGLPAGRLA